MCVICDMLIWYVVIVISGVFVWLVWCVYLVWVIFVFFVYGMLYCSLVDLCWYECGYGIVFCMCWMNDVLY